MNSTCVNYIHVSILLKYLDEKLPVFFLKFVRANFHVQNHFLYFV